jgi:hypothetical protein
MKELNMAKNHQYLYAVFKIKGIITMDSLPPINKYGTSEFTLTRDPSAAEDLQKTHSLLLASGKVKHISVTCEKDDRISQIAAIYLGYNLYSRESDRVTLNFCNHPNEECSVPPYTPVKHGITAVVFVIDQLTEEITNFIEVTENHGAKKPNSGNVERGDTVLGTVYKELHEELSLQEKDLSPVVFVGSFHTRHFGTPNGPSDINHVFATAISSNTPFHHAEKELKGAVIRNINQFVQENEGTIWSTTVLKAYKAFEQFRTTEDSGITEAHWKSIPVDKRTADNASTMLFSGQTSY